MMVRAAVFLPLLISAVSAQGPELRTTVRLVIAPTTVTDRKGSYVDGLSEQDFRLTDNGVPRDVRVDFASVPISLVIAVQASEFSAAALNKLHRIGGMIEPLVTGERGEVAVVAFDSDVRVAQDFTSSFDGVRAAIGSLQPGDRGSKMIDAVSESVRMLAARPPERRRVLLVFSEARDRSSKAKLADVVTRAEQQNVTIYPVTYSAYWTAFTAKPGTTPPPSGYGIDIIAIVKEIAQLAKTNSALAFSKYTGGRELSFVKQKSLEEAVTRIGEELHSQYLLSFQAGSTDDALFHRIEVTLPGRTGLTVRTRPGYWMSVPEL
jgi:VWFA-related protein